VFVKNTSLETKFFVSQLVFFANTPPKHDISVEKTIKLVFSPSPLSTQHLGIRAKIGWFGA
jgi:hypothetical protein